MPDDASPNPLSNLCQIPWFAVLDQIGWDELLEARLIIKTLAGRLLPTISLIEDLSLRPVVSRLAKLLLQLPVDPQPQPRCDWTLAK